VKQFVEMIEEVKVMESEILSNAASPKIGNAANESRWAMWKSGCTARQAIERYCSPELRDRYTKALAHESSQDRTADLSLLFCRSFPGQYIANSAAIRSHIQEREQREWTLLSELEKQIYEEVDKRELTPVAFRVPRSPNDSPIEIPPDILCSCVGWSLAPQFGVNGLEFSGLRFASADFCNAGIAETRGPGRSSRREQIRQAIKDLYDRKQISLTEKRAPQLPKIKKRVLELFPADERGERGLGREVLNQELKRFIAHQQRPGNPKNYKFKGDL
jgi:hypothetical protein